MVDYRKVCYLFITIIGIPVNLLAIVILCRGKCGLSKCITRYLVAMAGADLMVVIIEVLLYQIIESYGKLSVLGDAPFCLVHYSLCHVASDCSVWFTVAFTFDRFVTICWSAMKVKYCTPKIASVVIGTIGIGLCLKNIPFYFLYMETSAFRVGDKWFCFGKPALPMTDTLDGFYWVDRVFNPLLPFFLILFLNTLTVRMILAASKVRRTLKGQGNREKQLDPELKSRRQSIVLLFTLSASFLVCWATTTLVFILTRCLYTDLETSIRLFQAQDAGTVMQLFSCCTNTFIYGITQTKFREQVRIAMLYPVNLLFSFLK
ncbi:probable G-protein coupled receptor 139 [Leucoraja erinacea]|uniref:probable G-protein coupled receptor 139 n=1 Tax=Leucoraja erinaceus TaxID=7782 RepID=UPI002458C43C|nr:probable G-protein coupled receptor 139 [Leucoraja erinacea]